MATTRPVVQQNQARDEGVIDGKQVKKTGPAGNRRALGDIGNVVNRPVTRSFRAQLLANAQAAAVPENKKQVCVNVEARVPIGGEKPAKKPAKAAQKKVNEKPKPEEVIVLSPDTEEVPKPKQDKAAVPENKKKHDVGSSAKKNGPTFSSVLTARSKAACGQANNPKAEIFNIDELDVGNDLAAVEYVEDMYKFYKLVENESQPGDYMPCQPEINEKMRAILVDWLVDVHRKFELAPETLYLTINIMDRFLSVKTVPRKELQLLGISATLIASKYEEIWAPEVNDLVCISDRAYSHQQILIMEKTILGRLEWNLTVPTHYVFLVRFIKAAIADKELATMTFYLAELGVMHYETVKFCPSMVAASAVYAACCTLNVSPAWTETLEFHSGFTEEQVMDCAKILVKLQSKAAENRLQVVYRKYSNFQLFAVAQRPPAKSLLPGDDVTGQVALQGN
ncbi:hypothetical protein ACFE04_015663 [Oxalis oulophora]